MNPQNRFGRSDSNKPEEGFIEIKPKQKNISDQEYQGYQNRSYPQSKQYSNQNKQSGQYQRTQNHDQSRNTSYAHSKNYVQKSNYHASQPNKQSYGSSGNNHGAHNTSTYNSNYKRGGQTNGKTYDKKKQVDQELKKEILEKVKRILKLPHEESVQEFNKFGNDENLLMLTFISLIKCIDNVEQIPILYKIKIPKHVKKSVTHSYTPWHILAYKDECAHEVFDGIAKFIHSMGYKIEEKNSHGETALKAIFQHKNLSSEEIAYRLVKIAEINDDQVMKIARKPFNSMGNGEISKSIEKLRYAICVNHTKVLDTIARCIIKKTPPKSCCDKDDSIAPIINLLIKTFDGSENGFKNMKTNDESLALFFKINTKKLPSSDELLHSLVNMAFAIVVECNDSSVDSNLNLEFFGIFLGSLANVGILTGVYEKFVLDWLTSENLVSTNEKFNTIIKTIIRSIRHAQIMTNEMKQLLCDIAQTSIFVRTLVDLLFKSISAKPNKIVTSDAKFILDVKKTETTQNTSKMLPQMIVDKSKNVIKSIDVETLYFFKDLNKLNAECSEANLENFTKSFNETIISYPLQRQEIINRGLCCLLENITNKTLHLIKPIIIKLCTIIEPIEILSQKKYFENEVLMDIVMDNPIALQIWNLIVELISSL